MRPDKVTPAVQEKIAALIRGGHFPEVASRAAGIDPRTYYRWRKEGKARPNSKYGEFDRVCREAEAQSELLLVGEIRKKGGWKGALELLKRRFPDRWGDRMRAQVGNIPGEEFATTGPAAPAVAIIINQGDEWNEHDAATTQEAEPTG